MELVKVTIETIKGSGAKYDFDPKSGQYQLHKIMPAGLVFPFDFGFIPDTIGEDGDPLDVIVISETATFPGCLINCRIAGAITALQKEKNKKEMRNDRYVAIPEVSELYGKVKEISDLPGTIIKELKAFFMNYNAQAGKKFTPLHYVKAAEAFRMIQHSKKKTTPPNVLIEVFLPLNDGKGKPFPRQYYTKVKKELTKQFGGVTMFSRAPADGLWKDTGKRIVKDTMIIYEVMAGESDQEFWSGYKATLQEQFDQEKVLIRRSGIGLL